MAGAIQKIRELCATDLHWRKGQLQYIRMIFNAVVESAENLTGVEANFTYDTITKTTSVAGGTRMAILFSYENQDLFVLRFMKLDEDEWIIDNPTPFEDALSDCVKYLMSTKVHNAAKALYNIV